MERNRIIDDSRSTAPGSASQWTPPVMPAHQPFGAIRTERRHWIHGVIDWAKLVVTIGFIVLLLWVMAMGEIEKAKLLEEQAKAQTPEVMNINGGIYRRVAP